MNLAILIILCFVLVETTLLLLSKKTEIFNKSTKRKIYIDTSALMDGRILSVARTGFIGDDLFIPRSVLHELQLLADGKDNDKRTLARQGMENANDLERVTFCNVSVLNDPLDRTLVDERLITLAKENHGLICTTDYNLNRRATTEGIEVLNINDLAVVLRDDYAAGEKLIVKIKSQGSNPGQGVGHLPNGTMVVVEKAAKDIGQEIDVEIQRFVQSNTGRIIFATKALKAKSPKTTNTKKSKKPNNKKAKL